MQMVVLMYTLNDLILISKLTYKTNQRIMICVIIIIEQVFEYILLDKDTFVIKSQLPVQQGACNLLFMYF